MDLFLFMALIVLFGICAIFLVSGELSILSGLSKTNRYILAFFLSFGVLGFSVKTAAIGLLQQKNALNSALEISRATAPELSTRNADNVPGLTYAPKGKVWLALPPIEATPDIKKVNLGKKLFFDQRLSSNKKISCASCHDISNGGDDNQVVSSGVEGLKGQRNAPSVINAVFMKKLFWDGRAKSLEDQVAGPLTNPVEMAMVSKEAVVQTVIQDENYVQDYQNIYKEEVSFNGIADALASFEKTLISSDSAYDRFVRGDTTALSHDQIKGMVLFDQIGCRSCHMDPTFTIAGIAHKSPYMPFPVFKKSPYLAKYNLMEDKGKNANHIWRVPSLRNIEHTAPYFHNGAVPSLEEAVKVMATAQLGLTLAENNKEEFNISYRDNGPVVTAENRTLDQTEIKQLVAFLKALSGQPLVVHSPWENQ